MRSVIVERTLNVPKNVVWEKLSDIGNVYIFNPMVERSALVGDQAGGVGAKRTCALGKGSGMKGHLEEEVIGWNEGESLTIRMNSGPMPTRYMSVRFDLHEVAADRTGIRATVQYVMKGGFLGNMMGGIMMGPMLTSMMNKLFRGLEKHLLTGETITA